MSRIGASWFTVRRRMLSGYLSAVYDEALAGWNRHIFDRPNHAAGGKTKREMTEVVWCNF
jgi:DNA adenine methylase